MVEIGTILSFIQATELLGVSGLFHPDITLEIEATAVEQSRGK
jgi:hypothetical protein